MVTEFIDCCHPVTLINKLLTTTDNEYESGFVKDKSQRDNQLKMISGPNNIIICV